MAAKQKWEKNAYIKISTRKEAQVFAGRIKVKLKRTLDLCDVHYSSTTYSTVQKREKKGKKVMFRIQVDFRSNLHSRGEDAETAWI